MPESAATPVRAGTDSVPGTHKCREIHPGPSAAPRSGPPLVGALAPLVRVTSSDPRYRALCKLEAFMTDVDFAVNELAERVQRGNAQEVAGIFLEIRDRLLHKLNNLQLDHELI